MSDKVNYGLKPVVNGGSKMPCEDKLCGMVIENSNNYFIDLVDDGTTLCLQCGQCLRYARKKAVERGEPMESAAI